MMKRKYTRAELMFGNVCVPAGESVLYKTGHDESCPLADAAVVSVILVKTRGPVVFRFFQNRWWWRGPSGMEYHIEKLPAPPRYQMSDQHCDTVTLGTILH